MNRDLPGDLRDIADCIGREAALSLAGKVIRWQRTDKRRGRCGEVYIPRRLDRHCRLLELVDREQAELLVAAFAGSLLRVSVPAVLIRQFLADSARRLRAEGLRYVEIGEALGVSARQVGNLLGA